MRHAILLFLIPFSLAASPNFILIGPPGCGKGTFSSFMVQQHGYQQICPGDIIRTHIKNNTELGKIIKPIVENGDYIDDAITFEIMKAEIVSCCQQHKSFILDGFPRNQAGLDFLIQLFEQKSISSTVRIVHFMISDQICLERIRTRMVCFNCYHVFNKQTNPPKITMICDHCNAPLEFRLGDNEKITLKRLAYYRETIEPLVHQAQNFFPVITIDSSKSLEDCKEFYKTLCQEM
jgi:adenylate kinase